MEMQLDIYDLEKDLKVLKRRAYPFATKETLNQAAFHGREIAQRTIERRFIERNRWTRGSVRYNRTTTLDVDRQQTEVGSTEDYMRTQEIGGARRKRGKHGVPIPTSYSAGQSHAKQRTRITRRPNRLQAIRFRRKQFRSLGKNYKQRLLVAVLMAVKTGDRFLYAEFPNNRRGIMRVVGGRRGNTRGWPGNARLEMVHDLSRGIVIIPPTPWLRPTTNEVNRMIPDLYRKALLFQLRRHKLIT